ncbi:c-type cytochrome [Roseomonas sp. CCTCC AB2023176]|uniref:c-type cytochrome n=1 Tax=Roseomonas sp. CCTCC AB2023176 TaxID=3342640 RepID=UPI0035E2F0EE
MLRATLLLAALAAPPALAQGAPLVAEGCLGCHGPRGAGATGVPTLAGRDKAELVALMAAFRANERPATIMNRIVRGYSDAELAAAAEHFAAQR